MNGRQKPLAIITTMNRLDLTKRMLSSLEPSLSALQTIVIDNGSDKETVLWLQQWVRHKDVEFIALPRNIGCPRALNLALGYRSPGQAVIKLDNDVILPGDSKWVYGVERLASNFGKGVHPNTLPVAMVGAFYNAYTEDATSKARIKARLTWEFSDLYAVYPVIGHAVYHSAEFMDEVGYFDVLSDEHLYGFEDLVMSTKAALMGWLQFVWGGWHVENIQRRSALEGRDDHVAAMRPLYNRRISSLRDGGSFYTGPDGYPTGRPSQ